MIKICHYVRGFFLRKWNGAPRPLFFLPDQDATTNFDSFEAPNEGITPVKASLVQRSITALVSLFGRKKSVRRWQAVNLRKEADGEEEEEAPGSGLLIKILDPEDAAIIIQCMLRRRFALLVRDGKLDAAFQEAQIFWTEEKRVEEELKVAKQTRGKVFHITDSIFFVVIALCLRFAHSG